jgi:uncharacterized membrane protein
MAHWGDDEIELAMGRVLQGGVVLASVVMLAGAVLYFRRHGLEIPHYRVFRGSEFRSISSVSRAVADGQARGLIQLGALIMIATPVLRVAFAVYGFARERDGLYIGISLTVLSLLAFGLFTQR